MACGLLLGRPSAAAGQTITSNQTTPVVSTGANIYVEPGVTLSGATGIVNNVVTQTISNQGIISSGSYGVSSSGAIGTLSNSGTISGNAHTGIANSGSISVLTNSGLLGSTVTGLGNFGTIEVLDNSGTIAGSSGIYNGGSIGALTNTGTFTGTHVLDNNGTIDTFLNAGSMSVTGFAVVNNSTLGSFINSGIIAGGTGIENADTIGAITNSGIISGSSNAVFNIRTLGTLTNSGTIAGQDEGVDNEGFIGTLINVGAITGGDIGIFNNSASFVSTVEPAAAAFGSSAFADGAGIATLSNSGLINGNFAGIDNAGFIGTLINAGTISGGSYGIEDPGFFQEEEADFAEVGGSPAATTALASLGIGTLTNSGTISGGTDGIFNGGGEGIFTIQPEGAIDSASPDLAFDPEETGAVIEVLTNAQTGVITGGRAAIENSGAIGTLLNMGVINGGGSGILNNNASFASTLVRSDAAAVGSSAFGASASIATLTNSGLISGGSTGIDNAGFIGTLSNSGTISGGDTGIYNTGSIGLLSNTGLITGATFGIYDAGAPDTLVNDGTIAGATGVELAGSGSTLVNTGTIASTNGGDAILFGGANNLVLGTGSQIIGTIDGGGSASQIALQGTGLLNNNIVGFGAGSALAVTPGADWTGSGNWTVATVTNDGTFQPGVVGTPLTLTGNYVQGQGGTLRVVVTPTQTSQLLINGTANLAGKIVYNLAPGTYAAHTYVVLSASNGIVGTFSSASYNGLPSGLTATTTYVADPTVNLVLTGAGTVVPTPVVVAPSDDSIFSAQTQALAVESQNATADLLGKATVGGTAASAACAAEAPLSPATTSPGQADQSARLTRALASAFCGAGGWIEATGSLGHVDSSGGAPSYNANTAGFLAGIDKVLDQTGTRLGIAVGYDHTFLHDKTGGSGSMGTTRVALYGAQPFGPATMAAVVSYAHAGDDTSRASGIGDLHENNDVNIFSGGVQASTHLSLQRLDIVPAAGIRVASVEGDDFAESASGLARAFAVSGRTAHYTSVQPYILAQASESFVTASQTVITPDAQLGYQYEADDRGVATSIVTADGTGFRTPHNRLDRNAALVALGISAGRNNWSLFANYTGYLSGNWTDQIGEVGLRMTF